MRLEFDIASGNFSMAGEASSQIKKLLKQLQIDSKIIKHIVVAVYEAEVNVVAHSVGGKLIAEIEDDNIQVTLIDDGPGIADIEKAMQEGYSTATKAVRDMGFGAGMGLPNIKRNTDEFHIESEVGKGTKLWFRNRF
jgi:anti-sigma regulatory factor (Ser/Thr protein kinase)